MSETCPKGHIRTEANTAWHKRSDRPGLSRRCKDCKKHPSNGKPTITEMSRQATDYLHEDIEDLLNLGATFEEILERGGYCDWNTMMKSLKRRGRTDLLERLKARKPQAGRSTNNIIPGVPSKSKRAAGSIRRQSYASKEAA